MCAATVKWAVTGRRHAASLREGARGRENAAFEALLNLKSARVWLPESPVTFKIEFKDAGQAGNAARLPYSNVIDGRTLSFTADDYLTAFKGLRAMIGLAGR